MHSKSCALCYSIEHYLYHRLYWDRVSASYGLVSFCLIACHWLLPVCLESNLEECTQRLPVWQCVVSLMSWFKNRIFALTDRWHFTHSWFNMLISRLTCYSIPCDLSQAWVLTERFISAIYQTARWKPQCRRTPESTSYWKLMNILWCMGRHFWKTIDILISTEPMWKYSSYKCLFNVRCVVVMNAV